MTYFFYKFSSTLLFDAINGRQFSLYSESNVYFNYISICGDFANEFIMRKNSVTLVSFVAFNSIATQLHPIGGAKVDRLGKIEALIEAGVVGARKRNDKLARVLIDFKYGHFVLPKRIRIHYCG